MGGAQVGVSLKSSPHDSNAQSGKKMTCIGWAVSILQPLYLQFRSAAFQHKWKDQCIIFNSTFSIDSKNFLKNGIYKQIYT